MNLTKILRYWGHLRFIPFGIRDRVLRRLHPAGTPYPFEVPFYGKRYKGDTKSYLDWSVFFYGAYEIPLLELIGAILKKLENPVVLDIGANVGHHTLFTSQYAGHVHAFEPFPDFCKAIASKVELNQLTNISIHNTGLGDKNTQLQYYAPAEHHPNKGTGSFIDGYNSDLEPFEQLNIAKGDDYLASLHLQKIDLIKIDVEGLEMEVLRGLRENLTRFRPVVIMEFSEKTARKIGSLENLNTLLPSNYIVRNIKGRQLKRFDFGKYGDIICFGEENQYLQNV